jgi:hypothetical protein
MSFVDGHIINAPVSIRDVQQCLSLGSNDLGTLLSQGNIALWAKYKPVEVGNVVGILTDAQREAVNWGIDNIPTWTGTYLLKMKNFWLGIDKTSGNYPDIGYKQYYWEYKRPTTVYRLHDFSNAAKTVGYQQDAEAPVKQFTVTSAQVDPAGIFRVYYPLGARNTRTLTYDDLTYPTASIDVGNMYLGVMLYHKTNGNTYAVTKDTKMSLLDGTQTYVEMDISGLSTSQINNFPGTYSVFPFCSASVINFTNSISSTTGTFMALLGDKDLVVSIQYAEIEITNVHGYKDTSSSQHYARFVVSLKNDEPSGSAARNYRVTVTLCNSSGTSLGYSGSVTGQLSGAGTYNAEVSIYIASIWSQSIYYTVETTITDTLKFKNSSSWPLTGPIQEETPSPT